MRSEVTEGQTITVSCSVESFPQSTLTLMRINKYSRFLKITENNLNSRPINSLYHTFTFVTSADAGWYVCRAQNSEGSKDSKKKELVVKYSPKHVTVQANPGLDVKENVSLTLSCTAESNPPVSSVTWRKTTDGREEIVQQTQTRTFRVNSASPSDSGLYSCEATNDIGSGKSQPAEVKVRYKPRKTSISVSGSSDNQVKVGRSLTLTCDTDANPAPTTYSWYRSKNQQTDSWWNPTNSRSLRLTIQRADEACYRCSASNLIGRGDESQPVCIQVLYPPTEPILSMSSEVTEGQTITVSCTVESFPQSTLTLMRINTNYQSLIITENNINSRPINSLSHTFTFVTSADAGWYVCRAQNSEGSKDSKQQKMVVKYSPKHVTVQANPGLDVKENLRLTLSCTAESNPPVSSVTWRKTTDGREEIVQQTQTQTFRVNSASPSDSGLYSCEATNDIGRGKSQPAEVKVRYSPKHVTVQANPGLDVKENVSLTLSCTAESNPPVSSVTWRKTTDGREEIVQQTRTQTFRVNSASPSDSGLYSCEATNDIGSGKSQPAEVKVRYSPKHVTVQANPGLDVKENVSLTLSCTAESNPPVSSVTWRKTTDGREEIVQQTRTQTFRVNSASPSDSGLYSCEATNDIGSGKSQPAEVKVRYSPKHVTVQANPGLDVRKMCR
ncbi:B-cell receptor CD22-like [Hippoglossus stenolepis]|uniref:B-cell receptor CD22-like n=1 Tax=Hippoglossus stenolepis TaxID=195615 RepID=UPI001FAEEDE4|nr:B-cell receptor CD22-like [Hippoglossus stenolepis]